MEFTKENWENAPEEIGKLVVKFFGEDRFNAAPGKYRAFVQAIETAAIERCAKIVDGYIGSEPIANDIRALLPKEE